MGKASEGEGAQVEHRPAAQRAATGLMALALAASPAYLVRPHIGPLPTTLLEMVLVAAIALGLYAFRRELPWRSPYLLPAVLLLLAATIDTLLAPDRRAAAGIWKAYFVEPVLAGLVVAAIARRRERARLLLAGVGVAGSAVAAANVAAAVWALASGDFSLVTPPVVLYTSANAVALYLEPLVAFAVPIVFYTDDRRERAVAGGFAAIAVLAILLSFSRAGWVTLGALVLLAAMFGRWRWRVAALTAAAAAALFAVSEQVRQRILVQFDFASPNNTVGLRLSLWRSTLDMLQDHPLTGGGLSGFNASVAPYRAAGYQENHIYPHNVLLNFWSETGLLGLAAFVWLAVQALRTAWRGLGAGIWPRMMAVGVLGLLLSFFLHGLVDVPYFKNDQALAFWALLGVQLGSLRTAEACRVSSRSRPAAG